MEKRIVNRDRIFNTQLDDFKVKYITSLKGDGIGEKTITNIENFIHKVKYYEDIKLKKDIAYATFEEIIKFLDFLKCSTVSSLETYYKMLEWYVYFVKTIDSNVETNIYKFITKDTLKELVDEAKNNGKYLLEREFNSFIETLDDSRDKVLFQLVYEGFYDVNLDLLSNLKTTDIDFVNNTCLDRRISDKLVDYIVDAMGEEYITTYVDIKNGVDKLIDSIYILRERESHLVRGGIKIGKEFNGCSMGRGSIINRVTKIKEVFGQEYITLQGIYISGILNRAKNNIDINSKNARKDFVDYCIEKEGLKSVMAYKYWKVFIDVIMKKENKQ